MADVEGDAGERLIAAEGLYDVAGLQERGRGGGGLRSGGKGEGHGDYSWRCWRSSRTRSWSTTTAVMRSAPSTICCT